MSSSLLSWSSSSSSRLSWSSSSSSLSSSYHHHPCIIIIINLCSSHQCGTLMCRLSPVLSVWTYLKTSGLLPSPSRPPCSVCRHSWWDAMMMMVMMMMMNDDDVKVKVKQVVSEVMINTITIISTVFTGAEWSSGCSCSHHVQGETRRIPLHCQVLDYLVCQASRWGSGDGESIDNDSDDDDDDGDDDGDDDDDRIMLIIWWWWR